MRLICAYDLMLLPQTTSNNVQEIIESRVEKRTKGKEQYEDGVLDVLVDQKSIFSARIMLLQVSRLFPSFAVYAKIC